MIWSYMCVRCCDMVISVLGVVIWSYMCVRCCDMVVYVC